MRFLGKRCGAIAAIGLTGGLLGGCGNGDTGSTGSSSTGSGGAGSGTSSVSGSTGTEGAGGSAPAPLIIPADRQIDWTTAGVPGGIPHWTRVCGTVDAATYGTGTTDATAAIQAVVDACQTSAPNTMPGPGVVTIPAGKYLMAGAVTVNNKSYITIRGAGADKTTVIANGGQTFTFGVNGLVSEKIALTGGATQGSTKITLQSINDLVSGQLIDLSEDNDPDFVFTNHGSSNDLKQMALITAVDGNTITITPPLMWTLTKNPVVLWSFIGLDQYAGLEDMKIDHSQSAGAGGASFLIDQCYGCWVKGIHSYKPAGYHTYILDSINGEVRDSFFDDSQAYGPDNAGLNVRGTTNAGVNQGAVTAFKFENNIFDKTFPGVEMQNASSGCVISYNYGYAVEVADHTAGDTNVAFNSAMYNDNHGPHDMMNLYEGNIGEQFMSDGYFGSASHGTLLRNYFTAINPLFAISWDAVSLNRWSYYYNVVGNVLGSSDAAPVVYSFQSANDCGAGHGIYRIGFPNLGNCSTTSYDGANPDGLDAKVASTLLRWGNYDYFNKSAQFNAAELPMGVSTPASHVLPDSFAYKSAPVWWPSSIPWPSIGPDVNGGQDTSGHAWKNPAQLCYESGKLGNGGTFSAASCYAD